MLSRGRFPPHRYRARGRNNYGRALHRHENLAWLPSGWGVDVNLTKSQLKELSEALKIRLTPYIPYVPHETQHAFLWLTCLEALYGGAAGGGKSDALLMAALQYVDVPGYNAILFRKTYADLKLPGSLIPRSHIWLANSDAKWNENDSRWTFPTGATLSFGYMRNDDDRNRYQSAEFQYVGFDELTHFSKLQYTYMFSRCRKPKDITAKNPLSQVPLRVRGATNPGGRGHQWVKDRFVKEVGQRDNEPFNKKLGIFTPHERVFIPAKLADNPSVDAETYMAALEQTDEATQAQLVEGDWDAREPGEWVIPDPTWIDAAVALGQELWDSNSIPRDPDRLVAFGIDWGEFTQSYILWPMPKGGIYIMPSEVIGEHEDAATVTLRMLVKAERSGILPSVARYDAAGIQSMRIFAKTARARKRWERLKTQKIAFGKYKKEAMTYLRLLFRRSAKGYKERIIAIHPENVRLIGQLRRWERKDEESDDVVKFDDHGPDAVVAGVAPTAAAHRAYIQAMIQQAKTKKEEDDE